MKKLTYLSLSALGAPALASAQCSNFGGVRDLVSSATGVAINLFWFAAACAAFAFFWGLAKFIFKAGDAKNHAEGKNIMVWGIIVGFVMLSLIGIIHFFQGELNIQQGDASGLLPNNPCPR